MTQVNASLLPSQLTLKDNSTDMATLGSVISSLSEVSPTKIGKFADGAFQALGKDGIKFLPFLTALVKAFQGDAASTDKGGSTDSAGAGKADMGGAIKSLIGLRNEAGMNGGTKGLDAAIDKITTALPNLSQKQFDGLLESLKAMMAPSQQKGGKEGGIDMPALASMVDGMSKQQGNGSEIDSTELGMLQAQISAGEKSNKSASASPTGNAALDAVLSAIKDIAAGGVEPSETADLAQVLASLVSALLPQDKSDSVLKALGGALGMPRQSQSGTGQQINVSVSTGGGSTGGTGGLGAAQGYYGGSSAGFSGRGHTFDGMMFLKQDLQSAAALSNFDPMSTNTVAYNYLLQALSDGAQRSTSGGDSKKLTSASMTR